MLCVAVYKTEEKGKPGQEAELACLMCAHRRTSISRRSSIKAADPRSAMTRQHCAWTMHVSSTSAARLTEALIDEKDDG